MNPNQFPRPGYGPPPSGVPQFPGYQQQQQYSPPQQQFGQFFPQNPQFPRPPPPMNVSHPNQPYYPPPMPIGSLPYGYPPNQQFPVPPIPLISTVTSIVRPPTQATPPAGWKPTITELTTSAISHVRQQLTIYIGKIPPSLDDSILQRILEVILFFV